MRGRSELKWSRREECESVRLMEKTRRQTVGLVTWQGFPLPLLNRIDVRLIRQSLIFDLAEQTVASCQSELQCQQEIEMVQA